MPITVEDAAAERYGRLLCLRSNTERSAALTLPGVPGFSWADEDWWSASQPADVLLLTLGLPLLFTSDSSSRCYVAYVHRRIQNLDFGVRARSRTQKYSLSYVTDMTWKLL